MKNSISIYLSCLFAALFLISCEKSNDIPPIQDQVSVESIQQVAAANRAFGLEIFQKVAAKEAHSENILLSPLSFHTAMNMAVNGAASTTRDQMLEAMHSASWNMEDLNDQQADWRYYLQEQSGHPTLIEANAFFKDPNRILAHEDFENTLVNQYDAAIESRNFSEESAKTDINNWVKENTQGKIDQIIEEIKDEDIAFLLNAIYYKANWSRGFDKDLTRNGPFITGQGDTTEVPFVNADRNFTFIEDGTFMAVDLPFEDSTYSLTMIRPQDGVVFIQDWIQGLTVEFFDNMYENMQFQRAHVYFPKMELSYKKLLNEALIEQGMSKAFSGDADFSNMGQSLIGGNIYISKVNHKCVLEIDEEGAEGAAVTSVGISVTSAPPVLNFNQPFLLVLRHIETNSLVFIGRVMDPSK